MSNPDTTRFQGPPEPHELAQAAIDAYIEAAGELDDGTDQEDMENTLSDLLADLMHWTDYHDLDFGRCLERAQEYYREGD